MHAISSYRSSRHTNPQTNKQTGPITIHCAAKLSAQCNRLCGRPVMRPPQYSPAPCKWWFDRAAIHRFQLGGHWGCQWWCRFQCSITSARWPLRSQTKKSVLVLVLQVLPCETRSCYARRHNDFERHSSFSSTLFCAWNITTVKINSGVYLLKS